VDSDRILLWIVFNVFVLSILFLDLGVFHRKAHVVSVKEAAAWSCVWVSLALLFGLGVYLAQGRDKAMEFLTGYVIERSFSVDNLFVLIVIFSYFTVPAIYQHRVLFRVSWEPLLGGPFLSPRGRPF
jgi:tellurite resistance protein TerC